jgi:hypothetical protein
LMGVIKTPVDCDAESAGNTLRPAIYAIKNPTGLGGEYQVAGAAVGAVSSAIAVHVASRRWLSFFR